MLSVLLHKLEINVVGIAVDGWYCGPLLTIFDFSNFVGVYA